MSASLYPTPSRRRLVRQISNGQVVTDITADGDVILLFPDAPTSWQDSERVTARVRELEAAGWVETDGVLWGVTVDGAEATS